MIHAKNCEKLPKFDKVTAKIVLVLFSGHGVFLSVVVGRTVKSRMRFQVVLEIISRPSW